MKECFQFHYPRKPLGSELGLAGQTVLMNLFIPIKYKNLTNIIDLLPFTALGGKFPLRWVLGALGFGRALVKTK